MRTIYRLTDEDIRENVAEAVETLKDDDQIIFPSTEAEAAFVDDVTESIIYAIEYRDFLPVTVEAYETFVTDEAETHGYRTY